MELYETMKTAKAIVDRLEAAGFAGAIVSGGCLRDAHLGLLAKDIDVFVAYQDNRFSEDIASALGAALEVPFDVFIDEDYAELTEVHRIYREEGSGSPKIEVIELKPGFGPAERVPSFDFGICQIWYDKTGLHYTPAFAEDLLNKRATLLYAETLAEHARSMRRFNKWKARGLPFPLVDTTGYDEDPFAL